MRGSAYALLVTLLGTIVLGACAPRVDVRWRESAVAVAAAPRARVAATQTPPTAATAELLTLLNAARSEARWCGDELMPSAPPLAWEQALAEAAYGHSLAMAELGFVAHEAPDGSGVAERIVASGYRASGWGETIAAGYLAPAAALDGFLASPSHCQVLMADVFEVVGAALVERPSSVYGSYWTVVVALP